MHPGAMFTGNAKIRSDQPSRCDSAQAHNDFGLHHSDLLPKIFNTGILFLIPGIPISGRTAFYNVCNIAFLSIQIYNRQHIIQQFAGRSNKWFSTKIFLLTGAFPNKHNIGLPIANTNHNIGSGPTQCAVGTVPAGFF
jgi:hypothetical protein